MYICEIINRTKTYGKEKSDKETEPKRYLPNDSPLFKERNHTFCNRIDQCNFAVYLLLAFTSFFFTGAADQSILDNQQPGELMQTANHVKITPEHAVHNLPNSL